MCLAESAVLSLLTVPFAAKKSRPDAQTGHRVQQPAQVVAGRGQCLFAWAYVFAETRLAHSAAQELPTQIEMPARDGLERGFCPSNLGCHSQPSLTISDSEIDCPPPLLCAAKDRLQFPYS